ncbi:MAG: hypothetical protein Q9196_003813 [Gyalolechia fulgens]
MAPGGDWLARKLLGSNIVEEMDRRNDAALRVFKTAGKNPQLGQPVPSTSHYSESRLESKVRGGNGSQAFQSGGDFPVLSHGYASRQQEVAMRGGNGPQPSQYGADSPSPSRHTEGRASQQHSIRPQQVSMRRGSALQPSQHGEDSPSPPRHTEGRFSQQPSHRAQEQPSHARPARAAPGGHSQNLLVNPYGVPHGAADSHRSVNHAPQHSSNAAAGSRHRPTARQSHQPTFQGGADLHEAPRSSHPRAVPPASSRQPGGVHRSGHARHTDGFHPRTNSRAGDFYTKQLDARGVKWSVEQ